MIDVCFLLFHANTAERICMKFGTNTYLYLKSYCPSITFQLLIFNTHVDEIADKTYLVIKL